MLFEYINDFLDQGLSQQRLWLKGYL